MDTKIVIVSTILTTHHLHSHPFHLHDHHEEKQNYDLTDHPANHRYSPDHCNIKYLKYRIGNPDQLTGVALDN